MLWPRGTYQGGPRSQVSRLVAFRLLLFQKFVIFGATCLRALEKGANPLGLHVCMLSRSVGSVFATPWTLPPPGSSVHRILQARILEWVAISFFWKTLSRIKNSGLIARDWVLALVLLLPSMWTSKPRDQTWVSCITSRFFAGWATREVPPGLSFYLFECVRKLF